MVTPQQVLAEKKVFVLFGASQNREKYSYNLFDTMIEAGYTVYPVNPRYEKIDNHPCFSSLDALPSSPEVVLLVLAPENTDKLLDQVLAYPVEIIWMPPGSWSENAVNRCREAGKTVLYDVCPIGTLLEMGQNR